MLTEEQIQRLQKLIADEHHDFDEEQCEESVRFADRVFEGALVYLPEDIQELLKKTFEGGFFEDLIQGCFRVGNEIVKITSLVQHKINSNE